MVTAVNPDDCMHCFCKQDTIGNLVCCKCDAVLITEEAEEPVEGSNDD